MKTENRRQKAEGRRQKAGAGSWKPEVRSQKSEAGNTTFSTFRRGLSAFRISPSAHCCLPSLRCLLPSAFCLLLSALCLLGCGGKPAETVKSKLPADLASRFNADRAWHDLERVVGFGPRPSGSEALAHTAAYIQEQLHATTLQVEEDVFTTNTPRGPITFKNIIAKTRPNCPPRFIIGGHYDTKWFPKFKFVGANAGGSSTAALL